MSDHDALLNAIADRPEEDTPRLMYADWLEENGRPERADFVRNQVELGQVGLNDPARRELVLKNVAYLRDFVPGWRRELPRFGGIEWGDFNRGLVEEVQAATEAPVVSHAAEIFAVPGIHVLRLRWLRNAAALARVPELARLRALRLVAARADAESLRALLASPHLGKLKALDLHGNWADDAVASEIAGGRFPDLAELWLGSNTVGDRGAVALADSRHLPELHLLDLRNNRIANVSTRSALRRRFGQGAKV